MAQAAMQAALAGMANVTRLSPRVTRVMGLNPSDFTLNGSCTYLVGTGKGKALIDTGGGVPEYINLIQEALRSDVDGAGGGGTIEKILLTHSHEDHVGGLPDLRKLYPAAPVFKLPSLYRPQADVAIPSLQKLQGDEVFTVEGATLRTLKTPGHCDDHVVFFLEEEKAIFTGDMVLGVGSTVFMCYHEFMTSLADMRALNPKFLYPGHGPVVEDGCGKLDEYTQHRQKREEQILDTMRATLSSTSGGTSSDAAAPSTMTAMEVVQIVYVDTPEHLHFAAALNVSHHLRKLWKEGVVRPIEDDPATKEGVALLHESEYTMDKGKETSPERSRVFVLLSVKWTFANPKSSKI